MRHLERGLVAVGLAAAMLGTVTAGQAQTTLKFSWFGPAVSEFNKDGVFKWGAEVERATNGRVKIDFLSKAAGPPPAHFDLIKDGVIDAGYYLPGITRGRFVLHQAAEFPFLGKTGAQNSVAYWRTYKAHFEKAQEHAGVRVLTVLTHGPGMIHNSKRPILKAGDLSGLKLRVPGETIGGLAKSLGGTPMFANIGQVPELLSRGVADGVFLPFNGIVDLKLGRSLRHTTVVPGGIYNVTFHLAMNPRKWDSLSKADQDAILSVSGEPAARLIGGAWDLGDARGVKYAADEGIRVDQMDAAFKAEVEKAFAPMMAAWVEAATAKGVDAKAALAYYRQQLEALDAAK